MEKEQSPSSFGQSERESKGAEVVRSQQQVKVTATGLEDSVSTHNSYPESRNGHTPKGMALHESFPS